MNIFGRLHGELVFKRRVRVLADAVVGALRPLDGALTVLDVGCGDGQIAGLVGERLPGSRVEGIEVLRRERTVIPTRIFDGLTIPHADKSFDAVTIVDVLHHAADPRALLREAARVARRAVVIKDHLREGVLAGPTLRFMDYVGNAPHGVRRRYTFWTRPEWDGVWNETGLAVESWDSVARLYPAYASWVFGRGLHFVARLGVAAKSAEGGHGQRPEIVSMGLKRSGAEASAR